LLDINHSFIIFISITISGQDIKKKLFAQNIGMHLYICDVIGLFSILYLGTKLDSVPECLKCACSLIIKRFYTFIMYLHMTLSSPETSGNPSLFL
jgi:hypothetical protein